MKTQTDVFVDLFRYNAWANARVFEVCRGVDRERMETSAPGTYGSLGETLTHLVSVEDAYLSMVQDLLLERPEGPEAYFAHDVAWFVERGGQVGEGYLALLPSFDEAGLDSPLHVPWFDFALTKQDGLYQVLAHSAQHRAQILSVLGSLGVEVPDLDYVTLIEERQKKGTA